MMLSLMIVLLTLVWPAAPQQANDSWERIQELSDMLDGFVMVLEYQLHADSVRLGECKTLPVYKPLIDSLQARGEYNFDQDTRSWRFKGHANGLRIEAVYMESPTGFRKLALKLVTRSETIALIDVGLNGIDLDGDFVYQESSQQLLISERCLLALAGKDPDWRPAPDAELARELEKAVTSSLDFFQQ